MTQKHRRSLVGALTRHRELNLDRLKGIDNSDEIDQKVDFARADYHTRIMVIKEVLNDCDDIKYIEFSLGSGLKNDSSLVYIDSITDDKEITERILNPLLNISLKKKEYDLSREMIDLAEKGALSAQYKNISSFSQVLNSLFAGDTLILSKSSSECFAIPTRKEIAYQITDSMAETSLIGPRTSFTNDLNLNIRLVRSYIESHKLKIRTLNIGEYSKTEVSLMYIDGLADLDVVKDIIGKIQQISIDGVLSVTYIEELLEPKQISLFPLMLKTERVDRVVGNLLEGRIALQVDGSNTLAILPITINAFFQTPEDYYVKPIFATFLRLFRYGSFILASTAAPLYVAISIFHYEVIPFKLLVPFAESIAPIPFPPLFEALLLEIFAQILSESSSRMAGTMGPMIGILGAVLVGQAAVQANLASPVLVITVAIGVVSSFSIPNYDFMMAARIIKFVLIIFAGIF